MTSPTFPTTGKPAPLPPKRTRIADHVAAGMTRLQAEVAAEREELAHREALLTHKLARHEERIRERVLAVLERDHPDVLATARAVAERELDDEARERGRRAKAGRSRLLTGTPAPTSLPPVVDQAWAESQADQSA